MILQSIFLIHFPYFLQQTIGKDRARQALQALDHTKVAC